MVFEYADAWSDKYLLAYIIPGIVAPYNIILVKTYIESIPKELEESAKIDALLISVYLHRLSGRSASQF